MRIPPAVWTALRLLIAAAILAAVVAQLVETAGNARAQGQDLAVVVTNFFSYFTIVSNLLAATALTVAAVAALRGREPEPLPVGVLLAGATTFLAITFVVYNTLLRNLPPAPGVADTVGWSNEVMHVWAPLFLVADLLISPARRRLPWRAVLGIVLVPILWTAYTLVRANLVTDPVTGSPYWYPYPFLDPNGPGEWGSVLLFVLGIALGFLVAGVAVVAVTRIRTRPAARARNGARPSVD